MHWSQVLSSEWRCSWSSADRRCSNYIWVINSFIAYWGATYIRDLTVFKTNGPSASKQNGMDQLNMPLPGLDLNFQGHLSRRTSEIEKSPVLHEMTPVHIVIFVIIFLIIDLSCRTSVIIINLSDERFF